MRVHNGSRLIALVLWLIAAALPGAAVAADAAQSPDAARIQELQRQIDALDKELASVKSGADLQAQRNAMQSHWSMMQQYMRSVRQFPGMAVAGCSDWTMMDPRMMGGGPTGCWDWGHGMMGPGMRGWAPPNESPAQYRKRMQTYMAQMTQQMAAIASESDPAKREALIRQHYDTLYRNMQAMRGMGWMWNRNAAKTFPDASSPGATLEAKYCSQCHAAPPPEMHTAKEWAEVSARMQEHIGAESRAAGDVLVPSTSELATIVEYLDEHAKPGS